MSIVKGNKNAIIRQKKTALSISANPAVTSSPELLQFLELSIGEKTDAYLLKLALRDVRTDRIAETSEKLLVHFERLEQAALLPMMIETKEEKPNVAEKKSLLNGIVTIPKSVLSSLYHRVGVKFIVVIDAISHTHRAPTPLMKRLSMPMLRHNAMLFSSPSFDENVALMLSFSDIELAFKISPSMLNPLQQFNAEVLLVGSRTIDLCLTEKLPVGQPTISSFRY